MAEGLEQNTTQSKQPLAIIQALLEESPEEAVHKLGDITGLQTQEYPGTTHTLAEKPTSDCPDLSIAQQEFQVKLSSYGLNVIATGGYRLKN
ncbi:MAG: hypothetical protein UT36_C0013G0021 [Candidatus Peregrinibacteria bacterium GW2011_GWF2_39_17]|nr:MAG: hypothetical protein UT36_C0013G0021 [Candidatus Peregrinibacteria bacterium GW2011_GWF2_39_17]HCW32452.1 hypothetical protein [Candidatus Peregrinibacteria bacterium]